MTELERFKQQIYYIIMGLERYLLDKGQAQALIKVILHKKSFDKIINEQIKVEK